MPSTPADHVAAPRGVGAIAGSLLGAWTLAIGQPLLDLIGRNTAFVVAHRLSGVGVVLLALVLSMALPLVLIVVVLAIRAVRPGLAAVLHDGLLAVLVAIVVLMAVRVGGAGTALPAPLVVALALVAGIALSVGYHRSRAMQRLFVYAAAAAPAAALLFLLASPARGLWLDDATAAVSRVRPDAPPVIIVIFDELPLASLLGQDDTVDAQAFPSFARLAKDSTFFRNATASHSSTVEAVPALLSGRYTQVNTPPTAGAHPTNIFSMLAGGYSVRALEPLTHLCDDCADTVASPDDRLALVQDLSVLQLHLVVPDDWAGALPPTDAGWRDFAGGAENDAGGLLDRERFLAEARDALRGDTPGAFRQFVGEINRTSRPSLHVIHTLMPHRPWRYLPDGRLHGGGGESSLRDETWTDREWPMRQSLQLHLAQTRMADRLLGDLLDRLEATGVYDRALLIVLADHGLSLLPGTPPRDVTAESLGGITPVPLFLKTPGQTSGTVSDLPVETVDVAPTVLDAVGVTPNRDLDGRSLIAQAPTRTERTIIDAEGKTWAVPTSQDHLFAAADRIHNLFPRGATALFNLTPSGSEALLGRRVPADLPLARQLRLELDRAADYEQVDTSAGAVPALVTGQVSGLSRSAPAPQLAIAVNGTVHAVTLAETGFGPPGGFRALVAPEAFHDGRNEVDVLIIDGRNRLARVPRSE